jgi:tetratricopeptide (TPR) repeat protein
LAPSGSSTINCADICCPEDPQIEQALVYIYSLSPTRRFIGCGALVEGGYVATCRHVWRMATRNAGKAELDAIRAVEIEFPYVQENNAPVRAQVRSIDKCAEEPGPSPDLVLLTPDFIPRHLIRLTLAPSERYEVGDGYILAGLPGLDSQDRAAVQEIIVEGKIAIFLRRDGRRQFTGSNPTSYWTDRGSSGSPVFLNTGPQLAGILSLSETDAKPGRSAVHEAFVVPATTIRIHVLRLTAEPVARKEHIALEDLEPVLDALGVEEVALAEIPARLIEAIAAARARAAEPVPPSNQGTDIEATIAAARAKLEVFDTASARTVLQTKISEIEETHRRRLAPLLEEQAAVEQLAYDYRAAKATLNRLLTLDPDRVWSWIELGRLCETTGSLNEAATAFRSALAAARRTGDERDESVALDGIGDVLVAQGNLPEALKSFRDGLAIAEQLAQADPGNAGWQRDLSISYERIGDVLVAQGNLPEALKSFRDGLAIRDRLAQADPGNAGWQRDLGISNERIGNVQMAQGDLAAALKSYEARQNIISRLAQADPGNAGWQRDLSVSHGKLAIVFRKGGETAKALEALRQGRAIMVRLTALSPDNAIWKRDLAWFEGQIAELAP